MSKRDHKAQSTRTAKIWLGISTAALISATGAVASDQSRQVDAVADRVASGSPRLPGARGLRLAQATAPGHAHEMAAPAKPDGEGAEGGAGTLDPRVKFYRDLGLIRGHLLVGDELVAQGLWDDALPHFLHPVEELYADLVPTLKRQGIRPFQAALKALAQTVKAKNQAAYKAAWKSVDQRLLEPEASVRKYASNWTQFTSQTVIAMLKSAASEYEQAVEGGRIGKPVEYQDSRGFVFQADHLVEASAALFERKDKAALQAVRASLAELKKAWPQAVPPATPVKDHAAVLSDIARVELAAGAFLQQ